MRSLRILIVTHSPLSAQFGAGQMALNFGDALRALGHEVIIWSPQPLPSGVRWWQTLQFMRAKLDQFVESQAAFDLIDCPATFITRRVKSSAIVVARSTQPDLLYILDGLVSHIKRSKLKELRLIPFILLYTFFHICLVLQGWRRADSILCLGSLELRWMMRWFPWWRVKLSSYLNALSGADQATMAAVRRQRTIPSTDRFKFLWIGRWASHKGTDSLVSFISNWAETRPQDTFTIAGCGSDAEKDFPAHLLHGNRVTIIPAFDREEVYSLLSGHDIGLFTSKIEGWGLVLNEMVESGMYVFATASGGTLDLQPLCKTLRAFPPPPAFVPDGTGAEISDEYFDLFSWSSIARTYLRSIPGVSPERGRFRNKSIAPQKAAERTSHVRPVDS